MKKILWVTNVLIGHHREMMGLDNRITGGTWMHAAYVASIENKNYQLHIVTIENVPEMQIGHKDGNSFYILPGNAINQYDIKSEKNKREWQAVCEMVNPDLVVIWGTETRFAYLAMTVMQHIPMLIYMQGVMRSIVDHYYDGVPFNYRYRTIRDFADCINKQSRINTYKKQVELEERMLKMATAVIVENDWCEDVCRGINKRLMVFRNKLPIGEVFYNKRWSEDKMIPHTIFTNAGGYPIKGHHVLLKALAIVKHTYPDFKCFIPGIRLETFNSFKRKSGYYTYLSNLIKKGGLEGNVQYVGSLSSEQMVDYLLKCNVYVMPSIVENHSSSLIESMVVGAPSVSSLVGGVADIVIHGRNGLLYNSLDAISLAGIINRLFEDNQLAKSLSSNCTAFRITRSNDFGKELISIYNSFFN